MLPNRPGNVEHRVCSIVVVCCIARSLFLHCVSSQLRLCLAQSPRLFVLFYSLVLPSLRFNLRVVDAIHAVFVASMTFG